MNAIRSRQSPKGSTPPIPEAVASELMRRFLVDPFTEQTAPVLSRLSSDEALALQSVALSMGVTIEELSSAPSLRNQVLEILTKMLRDSALTEPRSKAAKESLGQAGLLSPSLYTIDFADLIKVFEKLGERRTNITQVIHFPDVVQHLEMPSGSEPGIDESQSIFIREIKPGKKKPFLQMVVARRSGSNLTFSAAWRFYSEIIAWDGTMSPLDLLRKLVDRYGIPFSIANSQPSKFLLNESIDFRGKSSENIDFKVLRPEEVGEKHFIAQVAMKYVADRQKLFLSLGYVINADAYKMDVERISPSS